LDVAGNIGRIYGYDGVETTGSIAAEGDITFLFVTGGSIDGAVTAGDGIHGGEGHIHRLYGVDGVTGDITAGDGFHYLQSGGDVSGDVEVTGNLNHLRIYRGGNLSGDVSVSENVRTLYVLGGRITDSTAGDPAIDVGGNVSYLRAQGTDPDSAVISGQIDVEGRLHFYHATGGTWSTGSLEAGEIGSAHHLTNGGLQIPFTTTATAGTDGDLAYMRVSKGPIAADINAPQGHVGRIFGFGGITGDITAGDGLRYLYSGDDANGDVDVTGTLNQLRVRGGRLSSSIEVSGGDLRKVHVSNGSGPALDGSQINVQGDVGSLTTLGDVSSNSSVIAGGRINSVYARGDFVDSSIEGNTLGRIRVSGDIQDTGGADERILATDEDSSFLVRDRDQVARIDKDEDAVFGGITARVE
jgi:hypothetical protein